MKKELIKYDQHGYEASLKDYRKKESLYNELLNEAKKFITVKDEKLFEQEPMAYLQKEYLNKYPELKKAEVTFSGLLIMQQRDIKEFEKAIIKYEEFKTHFTKEPVKADFELYTQNDKQAQLTIDLKEIVKLFNKLHTNYGLTIHKGTFFQAVPQAFYGFELEPNPQLVLTF
jgi:hypothetical protein